MGRFDTFSSAPTKPILKQFSSKALQIISVGVVASVTLICPKEAQASLCAWGVDEIPVNDSAPLKNIGLTINDGDTVSICIDSAPVSPARGGEYSKLDQPKSSAKTAGQEPVQTYQDAADRQLKESGINPESLPPEARKEAAKAVAQENFDRPPQEARPSEKIEKIRDPQGNVRGIKIGGDEYYPVKKDDGTEETYVMAKDGGVYKYDPQTGNREKVKGLDQARADVYDDGVKFNAKEADLDGDGKKTETVYEPETGAFTNLEEQSDGSTEVTHYDPNNAYKGDTQKQRDSLLNEGVSESQPQLAQKSIERTAGNEVKGNEKVVYVDDGTGQKNRPLVRSYDEEGNKQGAVDVFEDGRPPVEESVTKNGDYVAKDSQGNAVVIDKEGNRTEYDPQGRPTRYTSNEDLGDPNRKYGEPVESLSPEQQQQIAQQQEQLQQSQQPSARTGAEEDWSRENSPRYNNPSNQYVTCAGWATAELGGASFQKEFNISPEVFQSQYNSSVQKLCKIKL